MISISPIKCTHQFSGACNLCSNQGMGADFFSSILSVAAVQALPGVVQYVGKEISDSSDPHAFDDFKAIGDTFSPLSNLFRKSGGSPPLVAQNAISNAQSSVKPKLNFVSTLPVPQTFLQKYKTPIAISVVVLLLGSLGFFLVRRK